MTEEELEYAAGEAWKEFQEMMDEYDYHYMWLYTRQLEMNLGLPDPGLTPPPRTVIYL